jgi:flavodoxin
MKKWLKILTLVFIAVLAINLGLTLYALPAMFTLPGGMRPGLELLTLSQATVQLMETGKTGWHLIEAARAMVAERMQYSRRNSFDSDAEAFERGYGFCTQQAYVLVDLLTQLGFDANAVHAFQNMFPDGTAGGYTWVRVSLDGETRFIDSIFYDAESREITFQPISKIYNHTSLFKLLTRSGEAALKCPSLLLHRKGSFIMNALIVYFSKFGNTKRVAEAIAEELEREVSVQVIHSDELATSALGNVDLVIMGTPTHNMNLPKSVRPVFERLPRRILPKTPIAAFDTSYKLSAFLSRFTAAKKLARELRRLGGKRIVPPETFHVMEREGPLFEGELDRAREWTRSIMDKLNGRGNG